MTRQEIKTGLRKFIKENFLYDNGRELTDDESFLNSGILDSTGIIELITYLEDTYGVKFEDEELIAENFDSVERVARFMEQKVSSQVDQEHARS